MAVAREADRLVWCPVFGWCYAVLFSHRWTRIRMACDLATLTICKTCRAGELHDAEKPVAGMRLLEAVRSALPADSSFDVQSVECLAICENGCAAAITMPGKWGYLLGNLTPEVATDLLAYAQSYVASKTGTVMPSRRPSSLANIIKGRLPIPKRALVDGAVTKESDA